MKNAETLQSSDLFSGLGADEIALLLEICREISYKKGSTIFFENDLGDGFYLIAEGTIKVYKMNASGKEQTLHILERGETFGEAAVFQGKSFPANADALSAAKVLYFPKKDFVHLIQQKPLISMHMLALLAMRLRKFTKQIETLSLKEVPQRLADYLLILVEENGKNIRLPISKGQLASLLGTAPETLSRIFNQFSSEGLIDIQGKEIVVLDKEGLEERTL